MILRQPQTIGNNDRTLWAHGNPDILTLPLDALLCSTACPGAKIVEAMDLAQTWRAENRAVISGFHTPVEKECLRIFLRGPQPIVICPARGLDPYQLPKDWQKKYQRNEILLLSPFPATIRRPTKETAEERTLLVLELAARRTVIHASAAGSLTKALRSVQSIGEKEKVSNREYQIKPGALNRGPRGFLQK